MGTLAPKGDLVVMGGMEAASPPCQGRSGHCLPAHPREATQQEAFKFRTSRAAVTPSRQFQDAS